jgi:hypothetical protein
MQYCAKKTTPWPSLSIASIYKIFLLSQIVLLLHVCLFVFLPLQPTVFVFSQPGSGL